jgi:hypothetical protein
MQSSPRPELQQKSSLRKAEDILEAAPKHSRTVRLDANVVAAFGDLFKQLRSIGAPSMSARKVQPSTASAQSQS